MKKTLLFIISLFIICSSFAQPKENINEVPKDTTQSNLIDLQKIKLYPNPVSDFLFVDFDIVYTKGAKLIIYNSIGATIYSKELKDKKDKLKIQVSDFKNGLYFCSLQIDGKLLSTKKILINH